ncbi:MAG: DUF4954 family protein, partial [Chitinophagaceae bacterium]|nr:DUF4954 family protein [Chitinophagaceae bacterium]
AALVLGQSNIAAGATIGSNHNSRAADGELIAARGFWPALCVSLKHNSKFATFTLLSKGDYPCELNILLPFSLVSNDVANNKLIVMPAYWFMYNMYALERNVYKYSDRDKRTDKTQLLEYNYLAPDSINEIFEALKLLKKFTALAADKNHITSEVRLIEEGEKLLNDPNYDINNLEIIAIGFENNHRPTQLVKVREAYNIYKQLVIFYAVTELMNYMNRHKLASFEALLQSLPEKPERLEWHNVGGQLLPANSVETLLQNIKNGAIQSWDDVHAFYQENNFAYNEQKLQHAYASLLELLNISSQQFTAKHFKELLTQAVDIKEWMVKNIYHSRAKDYQNEFRKMVYNNQEEMEQVLGKLDDNVFIQQQTEEMKFFRDRAHKLINSLVDVKQTESAVT